MIIKNQRLRFVKDGTPSFPGIDMGPLEVWHRTPEILTLKIGGHHYWSGRFSPPGYAAASFLVLRIVTPTEGDDLAGDLLVDGIVEFPVRKAKA